MPTSATDWPGYLTAWHRDNQDQNFAGLYTMTLVAGGPRVPRLTCIAHRHVFEIDSIGQIPHINQRHICEFREDDPGYIIWWERKEIFLNNQISGKAGIRLWISYIPTDSSTAGSAESGGTGPSDTSCYFIDWTLAGILDEKELEIDTCGQLVRVDGAPHNSKRDLEVLFVEAENSYPHHSRDAHQIIAEYDRCSCSDSEWTVCEDTTEVRKGVMRFDEVGHLYEVLAYETTQYLPCQYETGCCPNVNVGKYLMARIVGFYADGSVGRQTAYFCLTQTGAGPWVGSVDIENHNLDGTATWDHVDITLRCTQVETDPGVYECRWVVTTNGCDTIIEAPHTVSCCPFFTVAVRPLDCVVLKLCSPTSANPDDPGGGGSGGEGGGLCATPTDADHILLEIFQELCENCDDTSLECDCSAQSGGGIITPP